MPPFARMPHSAVAPEKPAPPEDYAAKNAAPAERHRFRGKAKVEGVSGSNARESYPTKEGGILTQAGFPEAAPKRWDDQLFENRIKHMLTADKHKQGMARQAMAGAHTPRLGSRPALQARLQASRGALPPPPSATRLKSADASWRSNFGGRR